MAFRPVKGKQVTFRPGCEPALRPESDAPDRYGIEGSAGEVLP